MNRSRLNVRYKTGIVIDSSEICNNNLIYYTRCYRKSLSTTQVQQILDLRICLALYIIFFSQSLSNLLYLFYEINNTMLKYGFQYSEYFLTQFFTKKLQN